MVENKAAQDLVDWFNVGSESKSDTDDYKTFAENDTANGVEFDDLLEDLGDALEGVADTAVDLGRVEGENDIFEEKVEEKNEVEEPSTQEDITTEEKIDENTEDKISTLVKEDNANDDEDSEEDIDIEKLFTSQKAKVNDEEVVEENNPEKTLSPKGPAASDNSDGLSSSDLPNGMNTQKKVEEMNQQDDLFPGEVKWRLSSPDEKFAHFYVKKREFLPDLLPGGQIPFTRYHKELILSSTELNLEILDPIELNRQMVKVNKFRERVTQIGLEINNQYFRWKRAVELFRGLLAGVEYAKPAAKQEGLVHTHLSDFEGYLNRLEGMHYNVNKVEKNLDAAFDSLSRQVTISQGEQSRSTDEGIASANERNPKPPIEKTESKKDIKNTELEGYDALEDDASVEDSKSDEFDWDDM